MLDFRKDPANSKLSKLTQSLNALPDVLPNFREAGEGNDVVMAIVRDASQRCQKEATLTRKESVVRAAINSALKTAGIQNVRWEEGIGGEGE